MAQKKTETDSYEPVPIDEPLSGSIELDSEYDERLRGGKSTRTLAIIFICYSLILVSATAAVSSLAWRKQMLHGAGVVDTPLRSAMRYEPTFFQRGWKANYTLMGTPSTELDDAWDDILQRKWRSLEWWSTKVDKYTQILWQTIIQRFPTNSWKPLADSMKAFG